MVVDIVDIVGNIRSVYVIARIKTCFIKVVTILMLRAKVCY